MAFGNLGKLSENPKKTDDGPLTRWPRIVLLAEDKTILRTKESYMQSRAVIRGECSRTVRARGCFFRCLISTRRRYRLFSCPEGTPE